MNKNRHRVVFNAARGLRVAVAECARALGKVSNTAATATPTPFEPTPSPFGLSLSKPCRGVGESFDKLRAIGVHPPTKLAFTALLTAFLLPAQAQIAAHPSAPGKQRPTILTTPNGVPLVNIPTPSPAGVSRNTYRQFDVNGLGAIVSGGDMALNVGTQLLNHNSEILAGGTVKVQGVAVDTPGHQPVSIQEQHHHPQHGADPHGWRKAKKTYQKKPDSDALENPDK